MYDETIRYCKIFKGPVEELYDDCFELGFSSNPSVAECKTAVDPVNNDQCDVNFYIYVRYCVVVKLIVFKGCIIYIISSVFQTRLLPLRKGLSRQFGALP